VDSSCGGRRGGVVAKRRCAARRGVCFFSPRHAQSATARRVRVRVALVVDRVVAMRFASLARSSATAPVSSLRSLPRVVVRSVAFLLWSTISSSPGVYILVSFRLLLRVRFTAVHRAIVTPVDVFSATSTSRARAGSSSVDDTGWAGRGADDEPTFEGGGATNTLFVGKSRHTLLFLQPAHQKSRSFPLSLLQDCFFGLPPGRGTPKREVAAACAASWATKALSSITSHCLLIQNDLRCLRRRRLCGKVHAPRRRRTSQ